MKINPDKCIGCLRCADSCEGNAIQLVDGAAVIIQLLCRECGECARICPMEAINED